MLNENIELSNDFLLDAFRSINLLKNWPAEPWHPLIQALSEGRAISWIGEGSSRLFPLGFAQSLARQWGYSGVVTGCGGRSLSRAMARTYQITASSNSGKTREIVEGLLDVKPSGALAVLGNSGGLIEGLVEASLCVLDKPERAVPATVSVIGQSLVLLQAVAHYCGKKIPLLEIADAVSETLEAPALSIDTETSRIWWCGNDNGVADELMLKCCEALGIASISCGQGLGIHGIHEVLEPTDLVVAIGVDSRDRETLRSIVSSTGSQFQSWGSNRHDDWKLPDLGVWAPFSELSAGWRFIDSIAQRLGRDPAYPKRLCKIGNEFSEAVPGDRKF